MADMPGPRLNPALRPAPPPSTPSSSTSASAGATPTETPTSFTPPADQMSGPAAPSAPSAPAAPSHRGVAQPTGAGASTRSGAEQSGGAATVQRLRAGLAGMDPALKDNVYTLLDDPAFVRFLLDNPDVLERAGNLDAGALRDLAAHMPEGNPLKGQLQLAATALGGAGLLEAVGIGNTHDLAQTLGVDPDALRTQLQSLAGGIRQLNDNPTARAAINVGLAAGVRPGALLRAIESGQVDGAALGRLIDGQPTTGDVLTLLRALRDTTPDHNLTIDTTAPAAQTLLQRLGVPDGAFTSLRFGADDRLHVHMGNADALRAAGLPAALAGQDLDLDVSQLEGNGLRLSTKIGFGTALKALFTESLTGNTFLDILLKALMVLFFPLTLLYVGVSSRRVDVDIRDGEASVSVDHLFGRTNLTSFHLGNKEPTSPQ